MSWAPQVQTLREDVWHGNLLRFATYDEAMENVRMLRSRWFGVSDIRVVETPDPVNARWYAGKTEKLKLEASHDQEDNSEWRVGDVS